MLRPAGVWVDADLLLWWMRGMHVPPLVTTGSVNDQHPGALGQPGTQVVFGNQSLDGDLEAGGRLQFGMWLNCCQTVGVQGEYFGLGQADTHFRQWSDGNPPFFRPFYNEDPTVLGGVGPRAERIAYPRGNVGSLDGAANVDALTRLQGAGVAARFALCRLDNCWNDCCCQTFHDSYRSYFTVGYRFLRLSDNVSLTEQLTSTGPTTTGGPIEPGAFLISDGFSTVNRFNGADFGLEFELKRNRWSLDIAPRVALGSTYETGQVSGFTRTTDPTTGQRTIAQPPDQGGLLTKSTNLGSHSQNEFGAVTQLTLKIGYQATQHTQATIGYDILSWSDVARAGDQIDLRTTAPGSAPVGNTPAYPNKNAAFWAQGLDLGLEFRW
jgi:hypothetical protein